MFRKFVSCLLCTTLMLMVAPSIPAQELPINIDQLGQLTPEQRAQAMKLLGQSGGGLSGLQTPGMMPGTSSSLSRGGLGKFNPPQAPGAAASQPTGPNSTANFPSPESAMAGTRSGLPSPRLQGAVSALKPFGYDLFSGTPTSFTPVTDIPIPSNYVLGPGDTLRVQIYGNPNADFPLMVDRNGMIDFPKLGPISVAGQSFEDVRAMLKDRVSRELTGAHAEVGLDGLRSIQVFLLGDVNRPGSYTVSSLSTVTNALLIGGGISQIGSLRKIQLKRQGRTVKTIDLYDLLLHGDSSGDDRLQPGDVIFAPPVGPRVGVDGEVKRPAIYELGQEGTLAAVLTLAGGTMASTSASTIEIERYDRQAHSIQIQIDGSRSSDLATHIQDGDIVYVRRLSGPVENRVTVMGRVRYPGDYEWTPGYDVSRLLQRVQVLPSDASDETYLPVGLIQRTNLATGARYWSSFNARDALYGKNPPKLQADDLVVILSWDDVTYLSSKGVREVADGNFNSVDTCEGLKDLADNLPRERSTHFVRELSEARPLQQSDMSSATRPVNNPASPYSRSASSFPGSPGPGSFNASGQSNFMGGARLPDQSLNGTTNGISSISGTAMMVGAPSASSSAAFPGATLPPGANSNGTQATGNQVLNPDYPACPYLYSRVSGALKYLLDQSIGIFGEVRHPGLYPVAGKTPLTDLIEAAGGRTNASDPDNIEYLSYDVALKTGHPDYQKLAVAGADALDVSPGDTIDFRPLYSGEEVGTVTVSGEFRFPAVYAILKGEKLSDLYKRAGGLTDVAYPAGAVFTRLSAARDERASYVRAAGDLQDSLVTAVSSGMLGKDSQVSTTFIETVISRLENAPAIGRVVISANPSALAATPDIDPVLEPGDAIFMPKRPISVTVIGQVLNPGALQYKPGKTVQEYVRSAGNYTQAADKDRTFVILPNGTATTVSSSFWHSSDGDLLPGSVVVVPRDASPFSLLGWSDKIFGVLSQMAITAASLSVVTK